MLHKCARMRVSVLPSHGHLAAVTHPLPASCGVRIVSTSLMNRFSPRSRNKLCVRFIYTEVSRWHERWYCSYWKGCPGPESWCPFPQQAAHDQMSPRFLQYNSHYNRGPTSRGALTAVSRPVSTLESPPTHAPTLSISYTCALIPLLVLQFSIRLRLTPAPACPGATVKRDPCRTRTRHGLASP